MATSSLAYMHRIFKHNSELADAYSEFLSVYEQLGHMERVPINESNNPRDWYLPYHAVTQAPQTRIKIRVVFDASHKTRQRQCLNDFLMQDPLQKESLQNDLFLILLNLRKFNVLCTLNAPMRP